MKSLLILVVLAVAFQAGAKCREIEKSILNDNNLQKQLEESKQEISTLEDQLQVKNADIDQLVRLLTAISEASTKHDEERQHQDQDYQTLLEKIEQLQSNTHQKPMEEALLPIDYKWVPWSANSALPDRAVFTTTGGSSVYVARVHRNGETIVGKVYLPHQQCYIPSEGMELHYTECEILTGSGFSWVKYSGGALPANAFPAGRKANGDLQYVGRVNHYDEEDDYNTPNTGTIDYETKLLSIPYGAKVYKYDRFDVLVLNINYDRLISALDRRPPSNE